MYDVIDVLSQFPVNDFIGSVVFKLSFDCVCLKMQVYNPFNSA